MSEKDRLPFNFSLKLNNCRVMNVTAVKNEDINVKNEKLKPLLIEHLQLPANTTNNKLSRIKEIAKTYQAVKANTIAYSDDTDPTALLLLATWVLYYTKELPQIVKVVSDMKKGKYKLTPVPFSLSSLSSDGVTL